MTLTALSLARRAAPSLDWIENSDRVAYVDLDEWAIGLVITPDRSKMRVIIKVAVEEDDPGTGEIYVGDSSPVNEETATTAISVALDWLTGSCEMLLARLEPVIGRAA